MSEIDGEHYLIVFKSDGKKITVAVGAAKRMTPLVV